MAPPSIRLPEAGGRVGEYRMKASPIEAPPAPHRFNRTVFAAAHVVANPLSQHHPGAPSELDWDATIAYRRHLLDHGFGVAEAMDTAQRGMGLDWAVARELIRRSVDAASPGERARIFSGVGTDQLDANEANTLAQIVQAYRDQLHEVQSIGGRVTLMASRALAASANSAADYHYAYERVLAEADQPVILHWLGEVFDPALAGYWGSSDFAAAADTLLDIISAHQTKIDGVKLSLLDAGKEIALRRRLPAGVKMYTGDDFNYPRLIKGDADGYSHALLGIFDAIAPAACAALVALAVGDANRYDEILNPTVNLSRAIFCAPTRQYKTGVVFIAWLNGFQRHFIMPNGAQAARPLPYFAEVFKMADQAGALRDPALAVTRMRQLLALYGMVS